MSDDIKNIIEILKQGEDIVLATIIYKTGSAPRKTGTMMIIRSDGGSIGTIGGGYIEARAVILGAQVFKTREKHFESFNLDGGDSLDTICGGKITILFEFIEATPENIDYFKGKAIEKGTLYLFGAGHVSLYTAMLAKMVDFRIVVIDDRSEFANKKRFKEADQIMVIDSFDRIFEKLDIDRGSYIVIVTRGHSHDKTVLAGALKTDALYIGMIGSIGKRDAIFAQLIEEGFTKNDIARVKSPIGLDIKAETPEEIAVSIASELILTRAEAVPLHLKNIRNFCNK